MKKFTKALLPLTLICGCSLFLLAGCGNSDGNDDTINPDLPPVDNTVTETPVDEQGVHIYDDITNTSYADSDEYLQALDVFSKAAGTLTADLENSLKNSNADAAAVAERLKKPFQQFTASEAPKVLSEAHAMYQEAAEKLQTYIDGYIEISTSELTDADKESKTVELNNLLNEANGLISTANTNASDSLVNSK